MDVKRLTAARVLALALAGAAALSVTPASAQGASVCSLQSTNYYTPPLSGTDASLSFRSQGTLSNCVSSDAGALTGARSAGNVWTDPATGFKWQEPAGSGFGSCTSTTLTATFVTRWADGAITVQRQTTTSNTWAITAEGQVLPSVTLTAVDRAAGQDATLVLNTTRFAGHTISAWKMSHPNPMDPLECTEVGLTQATRSGIYVHQQA